MIPLVATGLGLPWDRLPAPLGCASAAGRAGAHGGLQGREGCRAARRQAALRRQGAPGWAGGRGLTCAMRPRRRANSVLCAARR